MIPTAKATAAQHRINALKENEIQPAAPVTL